MSKVRVYIEPHKIDNFIEIKDKEVIHKIRDVLRLKEDNRLYVFDGEGKEYLYKIKDAKNNFILIEKEKIERQERNLFKKVALGFPLLREEKVDFILQRATELGVSGFIPFICQRSINNKPSLSKLQRWQKIIIEAVRQSGRLWLPYIDEVLDFNEIINKQFDLKLAASIKGKSIMNVFHKRYKEVFIIVGPEGDFSSQEDALLKEKKFIFLKLSPNILRTETAAIFSVGLINYLLSSDERR